MATILVHGADLMFLSRIDAQLSARGHDVRRVRDAPAAGDLAICDVERVDPVEAVALLRPARLLGFGSHEHPEALRAARQAGFDRVVARSAVAERLPQLVAELLAPGRDGPAGGSPTMAPDVKTPERE
jgi:hypothetical protein